MPDFVVSLREALFPLRSGWEWDGQRWGQEKGKEEDLGLVCKMNKEKKKDTLALESEQLNGIFSGSKTSTKKLNRASDRSAVLS